MRIYLFAFALVLAGSAYAACGDWSSLDLHFRDLCYEERETAILYRAENESQVYAVLNPFTECGSRKVGVLYGPVCIRLYDDGYLFRHAADPTRSWKWGVRMVGYPARYPALFNSTPEFLGAMTYEGFFIGNPWDGEWLSAVTIDGVTRYEFENEPDTWADAEE